MIHFLIFGLTAMASLNTGELRCLKALAEFEFGKEKEFVQKKNATIISAEVDGALYAWDGVRVFRVNGVQLEADSPPAKIEGVKILNSSEYLSAKEKKEIWNPNTVDASDAALDKAMRAILKQSFYTYLVRLNHEPTATVAALKPKLGEACSGVELTIPAMGKIKKMVLIKDEAKNLLPAGPVGQWETTVEPSSGASDAK